MRYASVATGIALLTAVLAPVHIQSAHAAPVASARDFVSRASVVEWIDNYRNRPEPSRVPEAVRALSEFGALRMKRQKSSSGEPWRNASSRPA